jgi:hypothetical protein
MNKIVIAEGRPSDVLTDMNLLRTYGLMNNSIADTDNSNERVAF